MIIQKILPAQMHYQGALEVHQGTLQQKFLIQKMIRRGTHAKQLLVAPIVRLTIQKILPAQMHFPGALEVPQQILLQK